MIKFARPWFLIFGIFSIAAANAQTENPESFLDKVHQRISSHPDSLSFTAEVRQTTYFMDKKWQPDKTIVIDKIRHQNGSEINDDIQKAIKIEDGKEEDITEKLKENDKKKGKESGGSFSAGGDELFPFSPEARKNYRFEIRADSVWNDRSVKILYAVGLKESSDFYRGNYYIDSETYDVLGVDVQPTKNPKFVKLFRMRMSFIVVPEGYYVLKKSSVKMCVNFLIKKIRMVVEEIYTNYQFEEI